MDSKELSKKELIKIMVKYSKEVGFPTQRKFNNANGLPSYSSYIKNFGSFKDAIIFSGIEIPKDRERFFNRFEYDDEYLLHLLKTKTLNKLKNLVFPIKDKSKIRTFILTNDEIDADSEMPSCSSYVSHFGGVYNAYEKLNFDIKKIDNIMFKKDMKLKFFEMNKTLGRTPNSRDIDSFSKNSSYWYCCGAYCSVFGSIISLYKELGIKGVYTRELSDEDGINLIRKLYHEERIIPTRDIINSRDDLPSWNYYRYRLKLDMKSLFEICDIPVDLCSKRIYVTQGGEKCLSYYEYIFAKACEENGIQYEKEVMYKNVIIGFDKLYRFDFKVGDKYFEIFGITRVKEYDKKTEEKIRICKENNVNLISLFPKDMNKYIKNNDLILELFT